MPRHIEIVYDPKRKQLWINDASSLLLQLHDVEAFYVREVPPDVHNGRPNRG